MASKFTKSCNDTTSVIVITSDKRVFLSSSVMGVFPCLTCTSAICALAVAAARWIWASVQTSHQEPELLSQPTCLRMLSDDMNVISKCKPQNKKSSNLGTKIVVKLSPSPCPTETKEITNVKGIPTASAHNFDASSYLIAVRCSNTCVTNAEDFSKFVMMQTRIPCINCSFVLPLNTHHISTVALRQRRRSHTTMLIKVQ
eukprot:6410354-Amphidinium_carterae.1